MFELADIYEAMRFLGCSYDDAVAWLKLEQEKLQQEWEWEEQFYASQQ